MPLVLSAFVLLGAAQAQLTVPNRILEIGPKQDDPRAACGPAGHSEVDLVGGVAPDPENDPHASHDGLAIGPKQDIPAPAPAALPSARSRMTPGPAPGALPSGQSRTTPARPASSTAPGTTTIPRPAPSSAARRSDNGPYGAPQRSCGTAALAILTSEIDSSSRPAVEMTNGVVTRLMSTPPRAKQRNGMAKVAH